MCEDNKIGLLDCQIALGRDEKAQDLRVQRSARTEGERCRAQIGRKRKEGNYAQVLTLKDYAFPPPSPFFSECRV